VQPCAAYTDYVYLDAASGTFSMPASETATPTQFVVRTPGDGILSVTCANDRGNPVASEFLSAFTSGCTAPPTARDYVFSDATSSDDTGRGRVAPEEDMCVTYAVQNTPLLVGFSCTYSVAPLTFNTGASGTFSAVDDPITEQYYAVAVTDIYTVSFIMESTQENYINVYLGWYDPLAGVYLGNDGSYDSYGYEYNISYRWNVFPPPPEYVVFSTENYKPEEPYEWSLTYGMKSRHGIRTETTPSITQADVQPAKDVVHSYTDQSEVLGSPSIVHPYRDNDGCVVLSISVMADMQGGDSLEVYSRNTGSEDLPKTSGHIDWVLDRTLSCPNEYMWDMKGESVTSVIVNGAPMDAGQAASTFSVDIQNMTEQTEFAYIPDPQDVRVDGVHPWVVWTAGGTDSDTRVVATQWNNYFYSYNYSVSFFALHNLRLVCRGDLNTGVTANLHSGNEYGSLRTFLASVTGAQELVYNGYLRSDHAVTVSFSSSNGRYVSDVGEFSCTFSNTNARVISGADEGSIQLTEEESGPSLVDYYGVLPNLDLTDTLEYTMDLQCSALSGPADVATFTVYSVDCVALVDGTFGRGRAAPLSEEVLLEFGETESMVYKEADGVVPCMVVKYNNRYQGDDRYSWVCDYALHSLHTTEGFAWRFLVVALAVVGVGVCVVWYVLHRKGRLRMEGERERESTEEAPLVSVPTV
ncbi:hypothetical protein KIPB_009137, partial [Kipferlia bialata]